MTFTDKEIKEIEQQQEKRDLQQTINLFKILIWLMCAVIFLILFISSIKTMIRIL